MSSDNPEVYICMFEAGGVTISIPGSIPLKKSRKVFDDVIMLHNIWNALNLVFKDTVVETNGEIDDEEDEELFEQ